MCWNICDSNEDTKRVLDCLNQLEPDVIVIQEALPQHVAVLNERFMHVATARDAVYGTIKSQLVIASNRPLTDIKVTSHFTDDKPRPSILATFFCLDQFLGTLSATVTNDQGCDIQILTVHTSAFTSPKIRKKEVERMLAQCRKDGFCVIAGDFNSFAHPLISWAVALLMGFSFKDLYRNERNDLNEHMKLQGFEPSINQITYPKFRLRLDQVFRRNITMEYCHVSDQLWGSDHSPVLVKLG